MNGNASEGDVSCRLSLAALTGGRHPSGSKMLVQSNNEFTISVSRLKPPVHYSSFNDLLARSNLFASLVALRVSPVELNSVVRRSSVNFSL